MQRRTSDVENPLQISRFDASYVELVHYLAVRVLAPVLLAYPLEVPDRGFVFANLPLAR